MNILEVGNLSAGYGARRIFSGVDFAVPEHGLVGILGANGSGKTTLLKALCGILASNGSRTLLGRDMGKLSPRQTALHSRYIPQRSGITIDISALDVVLMGYNPQLGLLEYPTEAMKQAAEQALLQVGLAPGQNYQTLSEGQKQLCILARTLLLEKGMLFLDEPESALDFGGRYRAMAMVRDWLGEAERGAVVTLHDPQLALNCCDRLLILSQGSLVGEICPVADSLTQMERQLEKIYGALSVVRCPGRGGEQLVLIQEADTWKR